MRRSASSRRLVPIWPSLGCGLRCHHMAKFGVWFAMSDALTPPLPRTTQAAEEKRLEDAKRADLIKQIRALELVPRRRVTALDPTYMPELGLLEQMSLAELRERLCVDEQDRLEEVTQKRADITVSKQEREANLEQRVKRLTAMRELAASQAASKRDATKAASSEAERKRQERLAEAQLKVHATIETKRAARRQEEAALGEELKAIRIQNQYLGADKETVERKKWDSQQTGAHREIMQRQRQTHEEAKHLAVHNDAAQRVTNRRREDEAQATFLREYEGHLDFAKTEASHAESHILTRQVSPLGSIPVQMLRREGSLAM